LTNRVKNLYYKLEISGVTPSLKFVKKRLARSYSKFIVPQGEGGELYLYFCHVERGVSLFNQAGRRELFLNTKEQTLTIIKSRFNLQFINLLTENNPTREVE